jgi:hypothetical protein
MSLSNAGPKTTATVAVAAAAAAAAFAAAAAAAVADKGLEVMVVLNGVHHEGNMIRLPTGILDEAFKSIDAMTDYLNQLMEKGNIKLTEELSNSYVVGGHGKVPWVIFINATSTEVAKLLLQALTLLGHFPIKPEGSQDLVMGMPAFKISQKANPQGRLTVQAVCSSIPISITSSKAPLNKKVEGVFRLAMSSWALSSLIWKGHINTNVPMCY